MALKLKGEVMVLELAQHVQTFLHAYNQPPAKSFYEQMLTNKRKQEEKQKQEQQRKMELLKKKEEKQVCEKMSCRPLSQLFFTTKLFLNTPETPIAFGYKTEHQARQSPVNFTGQYRPRPPPPNSYSTCGGGRGPLPDLGWSGGWTLLPDQSFLGTSFPLGPSLQKVRCESSFLPVPMHHSIGTPPPQWTDKTLAKTLPSSVLRTCSHRIGDLSKGALRIFDGPTTLITVL